MMIFNLLTASFLVHSASKTPTSPHRDLHHLYGGYQDGNSWLTLATGHQQGQVPGEQHHPQLHYPDPTVDFNKYMGSTSFSNSHSSIPFEDLTQHHRQSSSIPFDNLAQGDNYQEDFEIEPEKDSSAKRRNPHDTRYRSKAWQIGFEKDEQDDIYHKIQARWGGKYDKNTITKANGAIRARLDEATARRILANHGPTIKGVADDTRPSSKKRGGDDSVPKKPKIGAWPDMLINSKVRTRIHERLRKHWQMPYSSVTHRIHTYYDPSLAPFLTSEDDQVFEKAADVMAARAKEATKRTQFAPVPRPQM